MPSSVDTWTQRGWTVVSTKLKKEGDRRGQSTATIRRVLTKPNYSSPKFRAVAERIVMTPSCGHIVFCENVAAHLWLIEVLVEHGMIEEMEARLTEAMTHAGTEKGQTAARDGRSPVAVLRERHARRLASGISCWLAC